MPQEKMTQFETEGFDKEKFEKKSLMPPLQEYIGSTTGLSWSKDRITCSN